MPKWFNKALEMKPYLCKASQTLDGSDALAVKDIYPLWADLVEIGTVEAEAGYKFTYNGNLYKCVNANPSFQSDWIPDTGTESLYTRIDETHAGTVDDPIPYEGNMELVNGLYYIQDGKVYVCTRDTGAPVHHALADLVGLYVEVVE